MGEIHRVVSVSFRHGLALVRGNLHRPYGFGRTVAVGDAFGETFFYYTARNPATGRLQRKVTFVKRVVVYGLPILLASGYYLD